MQIKNRKYYEGLFHSYPDLVTLDQFIKMLGGIGDGTARKLLRANYVKHFMINHTYLIPKVCVINYVLSTHYSEFKNTLKAQI